jgi:hypothetical protein
MAHEWARFPDDILWRRSKLGLTIKPDEREALAAFMAGGGPGASANVVVNAEGKVEPGSIRR